MQSMHDIPFSLSYYIVPIMSRFTTTFEVNFDGISHINKTVYSFL